MNLKTGLPCLLLPFVNRKNIGDTGNCPTLRLCIFFQCWVLFVKSVYVKTNFNDFKTKFWSTFQECHSLGFSTKEWDGTQGSGFGIGLRGCADAWPALAESPQTLQPLSGCWLQPCFYFHPMHWHGEVPFASLHPPSPCRHPQQQRRAGAVTLP